MPFYTYTEQYITEIFDFTGILCYILYKFSAFVCILEKISVLRNIFIFFGKWPYYMLSDYNLNVHGHAHGFILKKSGKTSFIKTLEGLHLEGNYFFYIK